MYVYSIHLDIVYKLSSRIKQRNEGLEKISEKKGITKSTNWTLHYQAVN